MRKAWRVDLTVKYKAAAVPVDASAAPINASTAPIDVSTALIDVFTDARNAEITAFIHVVF